MTRGRCDVCDGLIEITPTDRPVGRIGSSMRWRLVMHTSPDAPTVGTDGESRREICPGSGNLI